MKQKFPQLKTDAEAETFVAGADLTDYDLSAMVRERFELEPTDKPVNPRPPDVAD